MTNKFKSNWATPPGNLIKDAIEEGLTTREEIRDSLGLDESDFESLLGGGISLSEKMAKTLSEKFGGTIEFWLDFDACYRVDSQKKYEREPLSRNRVFRMPRVQQGQWGRVAA